MTNCQIAVETIMASDLALASWSAAVLCRFGFFEHFEIRHALPQPKRQRTAALQDAGARSDAPLNPYPRTPALKHPPQVPSRITFVALGHFLGGSLGDDLAAGVATLRAKVDDPIGGFDHVEIVLDHQ